jgi:HAD superfamily hydrolase (TIGR01484 family)
VKRAGARGRIVLATDLDGTFAHGSTSVRDALVRRLSADPAGTLIYVTGRTPEATRVLAARTPLPVPDVLIADVGTSVLHGLGPDRIEDIEAEVGRAWPGAAQVRSRLAKLDDLVPQEIDAPRRVSYWIEPVRRLGREGDAATADRFAARAPDDPSLDARSEAIATAVAASAESLLADLHVDVLVSANVFLDVLPRAVNKGSTLRRVLLWLGADERDCVVAGDSLNDLTLFEEGLRGIAVGNCEPALRRRLAQLPHVYQASAHGVDGVWEGLRHHGMYHDDPEPGKDNGG